MSRLIEGLESIKVLFDTKAKQSENAGYWKDFAGIIADAISTINEKTKRIENMETMIEDMEERIAIMTEGGWISVNDAMPDDYREVWVWTKGHLIDFGCHSNSYWSLNTVLVKDKDNFVTHWQYKMIPEPPKEGEQE